MTLASTKQIKAQIEKLRKDLSTAVNSAEKQRKAAQDSLTSLVNRGKQLLSSLGTSRIASLLDGGAKKKKATPAQKAVKQVKTAAKNAQKKATKAVKQAQKSVRKVEKTVEKRAQKAVKDVKKSVQKAQKTVQKTVKANLAKLPGGAPLSRAAMATSKGRAAAAAAATTPAAMPASAATPSPAES